MLVFTRKRGESIMIGDDIEIFILNVPGKKVHVGITAPPEIPVHRKEVYDAINETECGLRIAEDCCGGGGFGRL